MSDRKGQPERGKESNRDNRLMSGMIPDSGDTIDITSGTIGLIADSHSNNFLLLNAISSLKKADADIIIHLGDICDVQSPDMLDEAVEILTANGVRAVMGNNEHSIITGLNGNSKGVLKKDTISYLKGLPNVLKMGDVLFTHSTPFNWPSATRRPIEEYIPYLVESNPSPFRVLFRGHSHNPYVIEIENDEVMETAFSAGDSVLLHNNRVYVITVGAVENGLFSLFLPSKNEVKFLMIDSV